ncbi:hypothetical protein CARN8_6730007 [mine drainage metagenome]|uniref:Outer membrane efflux protein n=1 Tax=mine drainage metagenome TaxID=410659 RepID=A0A3P3ZRV0_9ZZZZ
MTIAGAYPNLTLTGDMGAMALTPGALFSPASSVWSLGAGVVQPIFHGGALSAAKRGAEAAVQSAAAQYRNTVVQAFRTVADVLRALTHDAATLEAERSIMEIRQQSLDLADQQYRLGGISYPALLAARVQDAQAGSGCPGPYGGRPGPGSTFGRYGRLLFGPWGRSRPRGRGAGHSGFPFFFGTICPSRCTVIL